MSEKIGRFWERQDSEPARWFHRFDAYYRPLGPERSLLAAYRFWHQMDDQVMVDDPVSQALERIRALFAEALPLLALVESILEIPEEERYVGQQWLPEAGQSE